MELLKISLATSQLRRHLSSAPNWELCRCSSAEPHQGTALPSTTTPTSFHRTDAQRDFCWAFQPRLHFCHDSHNVQSSPAMQMGSSNTQLGCTITHGQGCSQSRLEAALWARSTYKTHSLPHRWAQQPSRVRSSYLPLCPLSPNSSAQKHFKWDSKSAK